MAKAEMLSMSMSDREEPMEPAAASMMFCARVVLSPRRAARSVSLSVASFSFAPMNLATHA